MSDIKVAVPEGWNVCGSFPVPLQAPEGEMCFSTRFKMKMKSITTQKTVQTIVNYSCGLSKS